MDRINRAVLEVVFDLWQSQYDTVQSDSSPDGRLWVRYVDFNDDSHGWSDWSLADLIGDNRQWLDFIPENTPHAWLCREKIRLEWCRTKMPDGPNTERLYDIQGQQ